MNMVRSPSATMTNHKLLSVLLLLLACHWATVAATSIDHDKQKHDHSLSQPQLYDVLILGAGWSGMGAADYLSRHSNVSFLVLEASNRTGGRTEAIPFGKLLPQQQSIVVEAGSMWMPGSDVREDYGASPLIQYANQMNLRVSLDDDDDDDDSTREDGEEKTTTTGSWIDWLNKLPFLEDGKDADSDGSIKAALARAMKCVEDAIDETNFTGATNLYECGWKDGLTAKHLALESGVLECTGSRSGRFSSIDSLTDNYWGAQQLVVDQHPRGFARLLDAMMADNPRWKDSSVVFNARVEHIQYHPDTHDVTVSTKTGQTFRAKQVISTLSLGVLQGHYTTLFDPPLEKEKTRFLAPNDVVRMGNINKIYIQFPSVWWDNELTRWVSAHGELAAWRNLNHPKAIPGSHTLLAFCAHGCEYYETLDTATIQRLTLDNLQRQFPQATIPEPSDFYMSRHGADENRLGAFVNFNSCQAGHDFYQTFGRPAHGVVRFAGEAHCPAFPGYVHGALYSGREVAATYLYEEGLVELDPKDDDVLSICENVWEEACGELEEDENEEEPTVSQPSCTAHEIDVEACS